MIATTSHCLPQNCFGSDAAKPILQDYMLEKLKENMTDEEIIAGHELHQPFLDMMRDITCRGCNDMLCPHGFRSPHNESFAFKDLMEGQYQDRVQKGRRFLNELKEEMMKKHNISIDAIQAPSRKNPRLFISFKRNEQAASVICEVGKHIFYARCGNDQTLSVQNLKRFITASV